MVNFFLDGAGIGVKSFRLIEWTLRVRGVKGSRGRAETGVDGRILRFAGFHGFLRDDGRGRRVVEGVTGSEIGMIKEKGEAD